MGMQVSIKGSTIIGSLEQMLLDNYYGKKVLGLQDMNTLIILSLLKMEACFLMVYTLVSSITSQIALTMD